MRDLESSMAEGGIATQRTDLRASDGHETWTGVYALCAAPTTVEPADIREVER